MLNGMATHLSDRLLWFGLGVTLFFAFRGITWELSQVRHLTEIKKEEKEDQLIGEATEDGNYDVASLPLWDAWNLTLWKALKIESLLKLSESSSFDLRAAALKIIAERATKGPTRDLLLEDLSSRDPLLRRRALDALHFLILSRPLARSSASSRLRDLSTFKSLVGCLCYFLKEHTEKIGTTSSPILPRTRPPGEEKALRVLLALLPESVHTALEAGLVSQWLTRYPFPCTLQDDTRKRNVFLFMKTWGSDDPLMSNIFNILATHHEGVRQLRRYGLMGARLEEDELDAYDSSVERSRFSILEGDDDWESVWVPDGADTGATQAWGGRRLQEGTTTDQELRRRRREVMVFSEGGRPLDQDNIIEPIQNRAVWGLDDQFNELPGRV
ncbi:hypothetical protein CPC735_039050 [Coccidioides posadasii C735 delta SOWgp]|uniref:Uncharacterized protein n=1 Tax=Coccidioides posadasii (strain C735) TaxID=222929 RepID=C5P2V3_COCP7|nr:hypothetical protein CPC735_039050 [Coccidioides posadasii C735 delta SOWgp]EER28641.1 hypothetical protein CPC735_039050 [Coccidioides posadasii C735 delta SOWgp]|eukprot:XP_003070786.1 hypothetical protein CPC735_039050 [Coccidioides posadasii C735 delta SOWgp]